ncbi:MAG: nuclear transport factor 2 family protein [Cyclobacteriaceae bacterium]
MKNARDWFAVLCLALFSSGVFTSCAENSSTELLTSEAEVAFARFCEAYENRDTERVLGYISGKEPSLLLQASHLYGSEVVNYFESSLLQLSSFDSLKISNIRTVSLTDESVILHCDFYEEYTTQNGEKYKMSGGAMYLMRKEKSEWKIVHAAGAIR